MSPERLLRLGEAAALCAYRDGRRVDRGNPRGARDLKGTYGAPRIQIDLADAGIRVSRKRIARLMRNAGLAGVSRRKGTVTTVRDGARQAPDLVDRNFTADRPNMLWVADITYIPTWAGFLYLAVVLDAFSRRIVGWSMATTLHTQVVLTPSIWRSGSGGRAASTGELALACDVASAGVHHAGL